jgi:antitoxin MazE
MATTVQKWGNSLGIRVPKSIAEQVNLTNGTEVEFETSNGVLTIRPKRKRRSKLKLSDLLAKVKGPSPHREWANDPRVGRETI